MQGDRRVTAARLRAGRGFLSVLVGTALLAVLGFGLGIVAGLVMEEPGLLLDYVTGRTEPAVLDEATRFEEAPADAPDVAAAPPALGATSPDEPVAAPAPAVAQPAAAEEAPPVAVPEASPRVAAAAPPARAPEPPPPAPPAPPAPEPVASPPPARSGYSVQVGALADARSAEQLAGRLRDRGFSVYVAPSAEAGATRWRVRVGPVETRDQAQQLATRLEREKLPTWVLAEGRR